MQQEKFDRKELLLEITNLINAGKENEALDKLQCTIENEDSIIQQIYPCCSESQRLKIAKKIRFSLDMFLTLLVKNQFRNIELIQESLELVLRRKNLTATIRTNQNIFRHKKRNKNLDRKFAKLEQLTREILNLTWSKSPDGWLAEKVYQFKENHLREQYNKVQEVIAEEIPEIKLQLGEWFRKSHSHLRDVERFLPKNSILVEFVKFKFFDFKLNHEPQKFSLQQSSHHYLAFVLSAGNNQPYVFDLGSAEKIDEKIHEFRESILPKAAKKSNESSKLGQLDMADDEDDILEDSAILNYEWSVADSLRKIVFDPIRNSIDSQKHIFLSPDGELNLIPFDILPMDKEGKKLLKEEYTISCLSVARDLSNFNKYRNEISSTPVIMGDPAFTLDTKTATTDSSSELKPSYSETTLSTLDALEPFSPVPSTGLLARIIADMLGVVPHLGAEASETRFWNLSSPHILFVGTHGIVRCDGDPEKAMLNSGLALAGANNWLSDKSRNNKGAIFASEIAGLNMQANELSVLCACESGIGDVSIAGEGVFGLRRAFAIAGTKTLVMSLWNVDGPVSALLMERFFLHLKEGSGCADSLQKAKDYIRNITVGNLKKTHLGRIVLGSLLEGKQYSEESCDRSYKQEDRPLLHPYFWGAWICQGDIRPLWKGGILLKRGQKKLGQLGIEDTEKILRNRNLKLIGRISLILSISCFPVFFSSLKSVSRKDVENTVDYLFDYITEHKAFVYKYKRKKREDILPFQLSDQGVCSSYIYTVNNYSLYVWPLTRTQEEQKITVQLLSEILSIPSEKIRANLESARLRSSKEASQSSVIGESYPEREMQPFNFSDRVLIAQNLTLEQIDRIHKHHTQLKGIEIHEYLQHDIELGCIPSSKSL